MIRKARAITAIVLLLSAGHVQAELPQFRDYPSTPYAGPNAPLILTREDMYYRTRLREASRKRPNFAGHYVLATWGCGTSCTLGAAIDAKTGRVIHFGGVMCCDLAQIPDKADPEQVLTRLNSRLVMTEALVRDGKMVAAHYFLLEDGRFKHIANGPLAGQTYRVELARPHQTH